MRFAVVTPDPAQWVHVRAFDEVAEADEACARYLQHPEERAAIAAAGKALLKRRPQSALLAAALA